MGSPPVRPSARGSVDGGVQLQLVRTLSPRDKILQPDREPEPGVVRSHQANGITDVMQLGQVAGSVEVPLISQSITLPMPRIRAARVYLPDGVHGAAPAR